MSKTWRDICKPIIAKVIAENKHLGDKAVRKALFEAYPFGERKHHPYKIWLDEVKYQLKGSTNHWHLGRKKKVVVSEGQEKLF